MAVRFAKKHNLRVTIKSTGIDVWGKSSAHSSFCINLKAMKHISIKTEATDRSEHGEVTVQTGVLSWTLAEEVNITKTRPCNIQQYFTAVKMLIFR